MGMFPLTDIVPLDNCLVLTGREIQEWPDWDVQEKPYLKPNWLFPLQNHLSERIRIKSHWIQDVVSIFLQLYLVFLLDLIPHRRFVDLAGTFPHGG